MDSVTVAAIPPVAALFVAAVDYKGTFSLGTIVVLFATVAAAAWFNLTRKNDRQELKDAAAAWKDERDAALAKVERLEDELKAERERCNDALAQVTDLSADVAKWQERTDVTQMARQLSTEHKEILAGLQALTTAVSTLAASLPQQLK